MKKYMFLGLMFFAFISIFKYFANAQSVKVGGYMQTWLFLNQQTTELIPSMYKDGIESTSGIRIRRARLTANATLNETFGANVTLEFAGATRNLLDFTVTAKIAPELMFTVGQFTVPCQMYETSRLPSTRQTLYELSDISINLSSLMGLDAYRDIGIMVSGNINNMFRYYAYYGNGHGRLFYAGTNILNRKLSDGLYGARLEIEPLKGLSIGGHYAINKQDYVYTTNGLWGMDIKSYSIDLATEGFGLPFLSTIISYGSVGLKEEYGYHTWDYSGLSATLMFNVTKQIQLVGRFDNGNAIPRSAYDNENSKFDNIVLGANWYFYKDDSEIFKIGINYHIKNESLEIDKLDNNALLIWMQVKF
jgi:hypothetical protein